MYGINCHRIGYLSKIFHHHQHTRILSTILLNKSINNKLDRSDNPSNYITRFVSVQNDGIFKELIKKIPFLNINKNRLKATGYYLYELAADQIRYEEFFERYSLPDTFYSWFVITELHVWMLMVRAMADGEDGRCVRNAIVQAMWLDVEQRSKKLGAANPASVRAQIDELAEQFQAALFAYDEGLLTNDAVLASALWRRFFQMQYDNPQNIEKLVIYIRKQIKMLDKLPSTDFLVTSNSTWNWLPS